jgi:acyl carrier protein
MRQSSCVIFGGFGVASLDPVARTVASTWNRMLDIAGDQHTEDADFFDLGGNSMLAVELLSILEAELDVRLDLESFFFDSTFDALLEHVRTRVAGTE